MEWTFIRKYPYRKSVIRGILILAVFVLIFSGLIAFVANSLTFLIVSFIIFLLLSGVYVLNSEQYFIECIRIEEAQVYILYTDGNTQFSISGTTAEFSMKRSSQNYGKTSESYLHITYRNQHLINQYTIGSWRYDDIKYFDSLNPAHIPGPDEVFGGKIRIKSLPKPPSDQ
ncbi:hypothetical protein [Chitinophaga deserti]|uniref:hypothetical protein n=1 Tax=Chitinophaga deserti TaxID=2164099 RepID=UPI000D6C2C36|nr:hypothetical protein [Chitinophaga deserti]